MAKVQGVKEKIHYPIYDAFFVSGPNQGTPPNAQGRTFREAMTDPRMIRFFVDVQNKTRLETNLQAAGVLPSLNTFEARALRVVASTISPLSIPRDVILEAAGRYCDSNHYLDGFRSNQRISDDVRRDVLLGHMVRALVGNQVSQAIGDAATTYCSQTPTTVPPVTRPDPQKQLRDADELVGRVRGELERAIATAAAHAAADGLLAELIYNSVTTLLVGEKVMIEMPTFWFPGGAGVSPGNGAVTNHGEPDPLATFRFAEPVFIEPQQNFRVEMLFPQGVSQDLLDVRGPLRIWVVLDGYLTRDVQ